MMRTFRKHGGAAFVVTILEVVGDSDNLLELEQRYLNSRKPVFNCAPLAASCAGVKHTEETRKKRAAASKKIWVSRNEDDRKEWGKTSSANMRRWWNAASKEQREVKSESAKRQQAAMSEGERAAQKKRLAAIGKVGGTARVKGKTDREIREEMKALVAAQKAWRASDKEGVVMMTQKMTQTKRELYGKLNPESVRAMRSRYAAGGISFQALATEFGVSIGMAHGVVRGKKWRDVQ